MFLPLAPPLMAGQGPKLEPVSKRFQRELIHPHTRGFLGDIRFSPDGKRIIAGDYPGGTIIVYDVATGAQLTKIDTGGWGHLTARYFFLTPDWRTIYVAQSKRTLETINIDGLPQKRLVYDGAIRAWDLETGQVSETFKQTPPRYVNNLQVAPDGKKFLTVESLPGLLTDLRTETSLWDLATKRPRPLPKGSGFNGIFSPDSQWLAIVNTDEKKASKSVLILDSTTLQSIRSIPLDEKSEEFPMLLDFALEGRILIGLRHEKLDLDAANPNQIPWTATLVFWDTVSGKQVAAFPPEEKHTGYSLSALCQQSSMLAITNLRGKQGKLLIFDVAAKKLIHKVALGEKAFTRQPTFSIDGKWIAVATQVFPDNLPDEFRVADLPQPRVHLVEVATGQVRETLVLPHGITASVCFSPDGKTLAAGGHGRVLLFDLTVPPGQLEKEQR
jgi:WD40 repeat protein